MPQSNIEALTALGSFIAALLVANLTVRTQRGELPGGELAIFLLRTFFGFPPGSRCCPGISFPYPSIGSARQTHATQKSPLGAALSRSHVLKNLLVV